MEKKINMIYIAALIPLMTMLYFLSILYYNYQHEGFFVLSGVALIWLFDIVLRRAETYEI